MRYVFVYGTLRRGEERDINRLRPQPCWIGWGSVSGTLYDLGSYPGIVLAEGHDSSGVQDAVKGEVYAVEFELEQLLDRIEEVWPQSTGEYSKRDCVVRVSSPGAHPKPQRLSCLVYEVTPARVVGKVLIPQGDWVQHRLAKDC